jgi:hypothetical protein
MKKVVSLVRICTDRKTRRKGEKTGDMHVGLSRGDKATRQYVKLGAATKLSLPDGARVEAQNKITTPPTTHPHLLRPHQHILPPLVSQRLSSKSSECSLRGQNMVCPTPPCPCTE